MVAFSYIKDESETCRMPPFPCNLSVQSVCGGRLTKIPLFFPSPYSHSPPPPPPPPPAYFSKKRLELFSLCPWVISNSLWRLLHMVEMTGSHRKRTPQKSEIKNSNPSDTFSCWIMSDWVNTLMGKHSVSCCEHISVKNTVLYQQWWTTPEEWRRRLNTIF